VPEEARDGLQALALFKEARGEVVPQGVRGERAAKNGACLDLDAVGCGDPRVGPARVLEKESLAVEGGAHPLQEPGGHEDLPLLVALAADGQAIESLGSHDVRQAYPQGLAD